MKLLNKYVSKEKICEPMGFPSSHSVKAKASIAKGCSPNLGIKNSCLYSHKIKIFYK
jgi:hypothetical protein